MRFKAKNILVTGGVGYIGSHTCKLLADFGYIPISYDNLSTGHPEFAKWGTLEVGELHDTKKLIKVLRDYKISAVIHFAASAYVGESVINPFKYYYNNVGSTLSLLKAMQTVNVSNIVFSSSCATYGIPDAGVISETCQQKPINPYGHSKLMIEKILYDLSETGEINQISLRYFNAAGADKDAEIGEKHDPETHLIPLAIHSAFDGATLNIFGTDFSTPDGTAIRDYIHVEDLAYAHILALQYLLSGGKSDFFNLGTGKGHSVLEIISLLKMLGIKVKSTIASRRKGDPAVLIADTSKAIKILNWQPRYTNIQDILTTAITWYKKERLMNLNAFAKADDK